MIRTNPKSPKGIVWLASYPKSGNTWLRMFLYHLVRLAGGHSRERDEINKLDRASTYETRLVPLFEQFLGKRLADATTLEVMRVRPRVQATIAERMPHTSLVKTHNLLGVLNDLPTVNLDISVGAIYIVRNPRDVAPSLARHLGTTIDRAVEVLNTRGHATNNSQEGAGEIWGSWSEHVLTWMAEPDDAVLVVRYEDMLGKPLETLAAVARHLGQQATPAHIAEAVELSSFDKLKRQEEQFGFVERSDQGSNFFASGKAGTWNETLTADQVKSIVDTHREQMARFGYLP
jgi:hypothetical protein